MEDDSEDIAVEPIEVTAMHLHDDNVNDHHIKLLSEQVESIEEYLLKKRKWPLKGWQKVRYVKYLRD